MDSRVPRFTSCSIDQCGRPGIRGFSCGQCERHLCAHHLGSSHNCVTEQDDDAWAESINQEISRLLAQVSLDKLTQRASALRDGVKCKFEPGKHIGPGAIMGCANYHGWITFADGQRWLVRIPRTGTGDVPDKLIEYLVASEHATLKFLHSISIPVPRPFGYGLRSDPDNEVGVSYLFMEPLKGEPYSSTTATAERKERCFEQLVDIFIKISQHPVSEIGSLIVQMEHLEVGPVASNRFVALGIYGPFKTAREYFSSIIEQYLDLISDRQLYYEHSRDAFLYYVTLRQNIGELCKDDSHKPHRYYVKNVDDKGDHILVDSDGNITGIIDWQFARCVPAFEAFGPSYFTADLATLYSSQSGITADDELLATLAEKKGAHDLAKHLRGTEIARRFHHGLGGNSVLEEEIEELIKGTLIAFGIARKPEEVDLNVWREQTANICQSDPRWQRLLTEV